jgi:predicted transcriptional regulator
MTEYMMLPIRMYASSSETGPALARAGPERYKTPLPMEEAVMSLGP